MIVKDNYDTADLPTTAGSLSLEGSIPPDDAFQVQKLREAGAIVVAKSNMAEFAFSPYETVGSALPGYTRNPYALNRVTAGSSGGTAAAVAASFGVVGLGTDTGNSIRGPSSHQSLVGIRSTMGLTSRDGIVPLSLGRDIGGPMARTVADAVAVFDVIAGEDPADPVTAQSRELRAARYADSLRLDGLNGARIGVLREMSDETADPEVIARLAEALEAMRTLGATIVDPVAIGPDDGPLGPDAPPSLALICTMQSNSSCSPVNNERSSSELSVAAAFAIAAIRSGSCDSSSTSRAISCRSSASSISDASAS